MDAETNAWTWGLLALSGVAVGVFITVAVLIVAGGNRYDDDRDA